MARAQILVADSDLGFAGGLAADLESLGYAVTAVVSSPEEALQKAEETRPDLVLLDLGFFQEDKKWKSSQELREGMPNLVYLVGEEDPQTLERAKIAHSFDYLRKAYDSRELETIIDMALYRWKLEGESRQDQEEQRQSRQKWHQRDDKLTAEISKITAKIKAETDRQQSLEEALQAERQKLYAVLDTLPAYVVLLAPDYSVPFANREFVKRFGASKGRKCYEFLFGHTSPCPDCETYKVLDTNAPHEWEWTGPDGRNYQIYDFPFPDTDGATMILEMGLDVTVLKEKEVEIQRANRALRTLSAVNKAVVRAHTEADLLRDVCHDVVQEGGYRLAWIGYVENDRQKTVRPVAQAGYEEGYLETLKITWADTERGRGPTGMAIRTGRPATARNVLTDPHFAPWRQEALERGYASSLVLPLMLEDTAFGALSIYAGEADAFDAAEVQLLTDLAADVSFGVMALRAREERRQMAAALRRSYEELEARVQDRTQELAQSNAALQTEVAERLWSEKKLRESEERYRSLVDLSPDAIAVQSQGRYLFINPAGARLFGVADPRDMVGKAVLDVIHPDCRQLVGERICKVTEEGAQTELQEIRILRLDGGTADVEAAGVGITYQGQPAVQVMLRDITARKEMEKDLKHQASFPRLNPNPVLEADTSRNITYANAAALQALEKLGLENQVRAFLPPDLDEITKAAAARGETVFYREAAIGDAVFAETISFPEEFEVIRIYARDITPQKRAEIERQEVLEKLQVSEEELQATVEELQTQAEELQAQAEELQAANQTLHEAHTALGESNQRLALLAETTGRLLAEESPQEVVESVCRKAMDVLRCDVCFNFLLDENVGRLRLNTCVGIPAEEAREIEWLDYGVAVCGCAARDGCRIVAEDIQTTPDPRTELVKSYGVQAYACHPLKAQGRVLGTLSFGVRDRSRFTPEELELMHAVAGQVAIAMDRKQAEETLRESQKDLNRAQAVAHTGSWRLDVRKNKLLWSDETYRIFGIPQGTPLTYEAFLAAVHPEDRAYVDREWMAALRGEPYDLEHRLVQGDTVKWVRERAELEFDSQGQLLGGFGTTQDVTAPKQAEDTLQVSRNFLEIANRHTQMAPLLRDYAAAVQEHTGCEAVAIRILDDQGKIPYEAYAGFQEEFIACESPLSIMSDHCLCINVIKGETDPALPCYTPGASCYINRFSHLLATTPPGLLGETRNVCHRFGYESVALVPIVFGGSILGLIHLADRRENMVPLSLVERLERIALTLGTAINRVRAEEGRERLTRELETERARLQAIIASAPEAIVVADANGLVLMTNPAADRLYAHPDGRAQDDAHCALFQFCQADGTVCVPGDQPLLRSAKEGETHRNMEMVLTWPDGQRRDLLVNTAPIVDQHGRRSGAVGLFQDITQRKEAEDKIWKLNLELKDRIQEVSERTLQLEAANKELEAFSYSVSHDLRTPLRAIEGFARMLLEDYVQKLDEEGLRLLEVIRSNTRIMSDLIDDLLALSRLGRQEIRAQEIDLGGLVTSVFGELRIQEPARQTELILNPLPPAFGDRSLINQVLVNLLGNAVKFTKSREKAIIEVGGWTEGKENIYFIKDNGVGFDMRYVDKIFGVFQRLHRREDFEGTGVGLAIVQRIINRHGGRVWATGKVGQGAEFYFTLPRKGEVS